MVRSETKKLSVYRWYDWPVFFVCLLVLSIRCMFSESPGSPTTDVSSYLTNDGISLLVSTSLITVFCLWLVFSVFTGRISYKVSWIEPGFIIFLAAGIVGILVASDKRAAITNLVMMSSSIISGIMLVQVVNDASKVKILLIVLVSLGLANLYESYQQAFSTNQMLIDQYEQDPESQLQTLGIDPDSFNKYMYEHRLYSRDVRGFFKTSNSAGSFILLAISAAGVILAGRFKPDDTDTRGKVYTVRILMFLAVTSVMFLVMSKGAFAALFAGLILLLLYSVFKKIIVRYRNICILLIIISLVCIYVFVGYWGSKRGNLPGGNSMLVRWQYWSSAWQMIKDHWLAGIGPDNFGIYYTYYKIPAALETVKDPHNLFLAVQSQYGIFGLAGLVLMMVLPFMKNVSPGKSGGGNCPESTPVRAWVYIFSLLFALIILIRHLLLSTDIHLGPAELLFSFIYLSLVPALVFAIGCFVLFASEKCFVAESHFSTFSRSLLLCGLMAVIAANQIDFAIFEPGVWTAFWAVAACWICINYDKSGVCSVNLDCRYVRLGLAALVCCFFTAYLYFAVLPPLKAGILRQRAMRNMPEVTQLLDRAAAVDRLDDKALLENASAYAQLYLQTGEKKFYAGSEKCLLQAKNRNPAGFKVYEKLGDLYMMVSGEDPGNVELYKKAGQYYSDAIDRYPGSGRMFYKRALTLEKLDDVDRALSDFSRAVEIEDQYRSMFKIMYPDQKEVFSRLGRLKYLDALEKIKKLRK